MEVLFKGGTFFEGPRWLDGRWWVSDFGRHAVFSVGTGGDERLELKLDNDEPSGLGFMPDGSLLVVQQLARRLLRRKPTGEVSVHADLSHLAERLNDMVVDAQGRAYAGSVGNFTAGGPPGALSLGTFLILVETDGTVRRVGTPLRFPNGTVITPSGDQLIVGETLGSRFTAFSVAEDGSLVAGRVWAQFGPPPPEDSQSAVDMQTLARMPDGCCLDAEQCIWFADIRSARIVRVAEGGRIIEERALPDGLIPIACALGGNDGRTLLVCAATGVSPHAVPAGSGMLLTCKAPAPRAGHP